MATHPVPHPDLAGYVLGILDPGEARAFAAHLAGCGHCRDEVDELGGLPVLLAAGAAVEVPADLRARTFARIQAERPSTAPRLVGLPRRNDESPRSGSRRPGRSVPGLPRLGRGRLLAAAVVLVLSVAGVAAVLRAGSGAPGAGDGSAGGGATGGISLTLIAAATGRQHGVALIRDTPAGRVVQLRVEDLPPAPPGHRYVCWFVGPGDSRARPNRVAAGSFITNTRGQADVTVTGAAAPQRFPLLGVTLEPDDGNPQRRGPKVLVTKPPT